MVVFGSYGGELEEKRRVLEEKNRDLRSLKIVKVFNRWE
jgi:hypothetical protein